MDPGNNATFADVVGAPGGPFRCGNRAWACCMLRRSWICPGRPFSFDLPSDSPLRSFTASAQRNFEITVTGLSREVGVWSPSLHCPAQNAKISLLSTHMYDL